MQFKNRVRLIVIFCLTTAFTMLHPESVLLKDGQIFKGKLIFVDKTKITLQDNDSIMDFPLDSIEFLIAQIKQANLDKYSIIIIQRSDGAEQQVNLIKLTQTALYYKYLTDSELRISRLSSLKSLKLLHASEIYADSKKIILKQEEQIDINKDLNLVIIKLVTKNINTSGQHELLSSYKDEIESIARLNPINPEKDDFYEKFWARVYRYININTENLIWNLLENYSEKEKALNLIYNEKIQNISENTKNEISASTQKEELTKDLRKKIIDLRWDFYKRARKIILATEQ